MATKTLQSRKNWLAWKVMPRIKISTLLLLAILALAAFLHFYNLEAVGDSNLYYTAAVESMLQSWENFFFVAAEPGGSVTVDKPPLGLWIETISAAIFGVNGFAVVLPNILAGLAGIVVIYHIVQKRYGEATGLISALTLAVTPVAVAAQRNNTMDGILTFCLVLAAWAFLRAVETDKTRYLWLGAVLIGLGFNIKMLQAFLILPACYALYFLAARTSWWRKLVNLSLATLILLAVSFAWVAAVDLTPVDQRPYIGSSDDNTVMSLIIGHNGLRRLFGHQGADGSTAPQQPDGVSPPQNANPSNNPANPQRDGNSAGGPGGSREVGEEGLFRFFEAPLSKEASWLLPFALVGMLVLLFGSKLSFPLSKDHQTLVLWGGYLATCLVFFSIAGFFHAYYLVMLGPPLAVIVGVAAVRLWQFGSSKFWVLVVLALTALLTLIFQWYNAAQFHVTALWMYASIVLVFSGILFLLQPVYKHWRGIGFMLVLLGLIVIPLGWSWLTNQYVTTTNLVAAYQGEAVDAPQGDAIVFPRPDRERNNVNLNMLAYLQENTQDTEYLMAVPSSMVGASYVLETGRPVLYMGGFGGGDPVVSAADIAELVSNGELRYVMVGGNQKRGGTQAEINAWASQTCRVVKEYSQIVQGPPQGSPPQFTSDGGRNIFGQFPPQPPDGFQDGARPGSPSSSGTLLYDCGT
jgi:4-amino-4-deoxy-L-arabinose transferase-like glycosyltransferase